TFSHQKSGATQPVGLMRTLWMDLNPVRVIYEKATTEYIRIRDLDFCFVSRYHRDHFLPDRSKLVCRCLCSGGRVDRKFDGGGFTDGLLYRVDLPQQIC